MKPTSTLRIVLIISFLLPTFAFSEFEEDPTYKETKTKTKTIETNSQYEYSRTHEQKNAKRKYFVEDEKRVDAGIFHVGFGAGGNFYIEPKFNKVTLAPQGTYFKDFGFQAGVFFDYDYEDTRLGLRGWVGYKYLLSSVHAFAFDGMVRYLFRLSESAQFGLGIGASAAVWFRAETVDTNEEILFLPAFVIGAGFDFNPFLVDFKMLFNRIGTDATLMGLELSFGVRL